MTCVALVQFLVYDYFPTSLSAVVKDATIAWTWSMYRTLALDVLCGLQNLQQQKVRKSIPYVDEV